MGPKILGVIGSGFLIQVPTLPMTLSSTKIEGPALREERGSRGGRGQPSQTWLHKNRPSTTV